MLAWRKLPIFFLLHGVPRPDKPKESKERREAYIVRHTSTGCQKLISVSAPYTAR